MRQLTDMAAKPRSIGFTNHECKVGDNVATFTGQSSCRLHLMRAVFRQRDGCTMEESASTSCSARTELPTGPFST